MRTLAAFVFGAMLVTMLTTGEAVRDSIVYVVGVIAWLVLLVVCGLVTVVGAPKERGDE